MGKKKSKREKEEPEAFQPDEQIFFMDKSGHESRQIQKAKKKAGLSSDATPSPVAPAPAASAPAAPAPAAPAPAPAPVSSKKSAKNVPSKVVPSKSVPSQESKQSSTAPSAGQKRKEPEPELNLRDIWAEPLPSSVTIPHGEIIPPNYKRPHKPPRVKRGEVTWDGIPVAAPGCSYNPSPDDHKKAIMEAHDIALQEREDARVIVSKLRSAVNKQLTSKTLITSLRVDDAQHIGEEEEDDESSTAAPRPPTTADNRVTKTEKNKRQRLHALKRAEKAKANEKQILRDIAHIEEAVQEVQKEEESQQQKLARIQELKTTNPNKRPKFGKHQYQPLFPEVPFSNELKGSLRLIKPSKNVVMEQFKNFERRNMIEPIKKTKTRQRKYKLKTYVRKNEREQEDP